MSKSSSTPALSPHWMTLPEACQALGKSENTILRLVHSGHIQTKTEPLPGRKPIRLYRTTDVQRIATQVPLRASPTPIAPRPERGLTLAPQMTETLEKLLAPFAQARTHVPLDQKLWLSLAEASAYSGLSQADLRRLATEGRLTARKSGGWKIQRKSLEEFEG